MIGLHFQTMAEKDAYMRTAITSIRLTVFGFFLHHTWAELVCWRRPLCYEAQTFSDASWMLRRDKTHTRLRKKASK